MRSRHATRPQGRTSSSRCDAVSEHPRPDGREGREEDPWTCMKAYSKVYGLSEPAPSAAAPGRQSTGWWLELDPRNPSRRDPSVRSRYSLMHAFGPTHGPRLNPVQAVASRLELARGTERDEVEDGTRRGSRYTEAHWAGRRPVVLVGRIRAVLDSVCALLICEIV